MPEFFIIALRPNKKANNEQTGKEAARLTAKQNPASKRIEYLRTTVHWKMPRRRAEGEGRGGKRGGRAGQEGEQEKEGAGTERVGEVRWCDVG